MTTKETTTAKPASEKVFSTGWTGGKNAVAVDVYADRATVSRITGGRTKRIPLTAAQVAKLHSVWEDADGDVQSATVVAITLNDLTDNDAIGRFSTMAGGQIGALHKEQMNDL